MTASMPLDLRKARRKREFDLRALCREPSLDKMMVQEYTEIQIKTPSTAMSAGPLCWTISQRSVCRRKATGVSKSNSSPNFKSSIETRARFKKSVGFDTCRPRAQAVVGHALALL